MKVKRGKINETIKSDLSSEMGCGGLGNNLGVVRSESRQFFLKPVKMT